MLSHRAARKHLVASRRPKYFLRPHSAGSVSPGSGRPVRHELGYGPAVRLKPFRPHLTMGALSCAIRPEQARHAPTASTLKAAGAHPGGFPHRRPSPAPIEPRLHPVLVPLIFLRPARHYPRLWLRTPLGVGPTGLPPASNTASPARTTARSDSRSPARRFPGSPVIDAHRFPPHRSDGDETGLPSSQDDHPHVQRPIRRRVLRRPLPDPRRLPWPSPSRDRLGTLYPAHTDGCLTTLAQASLTLQTARSHPLRFAPSLSTTHGSIATRDPDISPGRTHTGRPP